MVQFEQAEPDKAVGCAVRHNKSGNREFVETSHEIIDLFLAFF